MTTISISLSDAKLFALDIIIKDKQDWAENFFNNRARSAMEELKPTKEWAQAIAALAQAGGDVSDSWAILLKGKELKLFKTALEKETLQKLASQQGVEGTAGNVAPLDLPLNQIQFFTLLELSFNKTPESIVKIIEETISDPASRIAAKNKFLRSVEYDRASPLFDLLSPVLGITSDQIDAAWLQSLEVK